MKNNPFVRIKQRLMLSTVDGTEQSWSFDKQDSAATHRIVTYWGRVFPRSNPDTLPQLS